MISKKLWNSFNNSTRCQILNLLQYHTTTIYSQLKNPYHHDFDYDIIGKELKKILDLLYKDSNSGQIKVVNYIVPSYIDNKETKSSKVSNKSQNELITFIKIVEDYEHLGDNDNEIGCIKRICPEATDFKSWEERDYEAESDYEHEYGELDEHIYQGYVEFKAPRKCLKTLEEYGYYSK